MNLITPEKFSLKNHSIINEAMIQKIIEDNPTILGLGDDLVLIEGQRTQPRAGILDLLFQNFDRTKRWETELQLGKVDESHIIRTIEYWDIEKKRYPQYDHCAVIIAEDITNRFLNVISLLNGNIPLIVIKMEAFKQGDNYWLNFTTVLNEIQYGLNDEDTIKEDVDRSYWLKRGTPETVAIVDKLLELINTFDADYELKYNKFYIGLAKNGRVNNFASFKPRKANTILELRLERSDEIDNLIETAGLELMEYSRRDGLYTLKVSVDELATNESLLKDLLIKASGRSLEEDLSQTELEGGN